MRGYAKGDFVAKIRSAGGEIYAISSEPQALASRASTDWSLGFETVGDPHHEVLRTCRERGWLDLFVNEKRGFIEASTASSGGPIPQHPKGYFQPGVLALSATGRVLYRWRGVPTRKNVGGAVERPTAAHVWSSVAASLDGNGDVPDAALDRDPSLDSRGPPWLLFVSLLIANGWFLRARGFSSPRRIPWAGIRILGFVSLWAAAFAWLPSLVVAVALGAWAAWIVPQVRFIHEEFQNEAVS